MPKALITGGAGFIGSHIADLMLGLGWDVTILDNLCTGFRQNVPERASFVEADVRDRSAVKRAASDCDVVFHLAASVGNGRSTADPYGDMTTNAVGTVNVLEACRTSGVTRVVYSSSAGVYGELRALPIDESHPENPVTLYGLSKLTGERACLIFNHMYGTRNICLRYFNVFGPRQAYDAYGNVIPIFVTLALRGEPITIFGDGLQTRDFVNVHDVAAANVAAALSEAATGVFNIGSATRITIADLVSLLATILGHGVTITYAGPRVGDVRDSLADISRVSRELGWSPAVGIADGLREYVDWARQAEIATRAGHKP